MEILIDSQYAGRTLLSYLKFTLKISSACITKLKQDEHGLEINGKHVTVRYILKAGDILHVNIDDSFERANQNIEPVNLPLDIIYEDNDLLIINKPPFMPTHPSHNHHSDTLANAVSHLYKTRGLPFIFRPVGRLDKNTSGIVVLGKNMPAAAHFTRERQNNRVQKSYIAVVCGEMSDPQGEINTPLKRQAESVIIRTVCNTEDEGAMPSQTFWEKLYSGHGISLVRAYPKTGRTHQIRVHLASIGHPILGDDIYGEESEYIQRHALHAYTLSFPLPFSEQIKTVDASIPEDMKAAFFAIAGEDISHYIQN